MLKRTPKKITDYFMAPATKRKRVEDSSTRGKSYFKKFGRREDQDIALIFIKNRKKTLTLPKYYLVVE